MFMSNNSHDLKSFQTLPSPAEYTLTDIQPQEMNIENTFGKPSVLNIECSQKENCFTPVNVKIKERQKQRGRTFFVISSSDVEDEDEFPVPNKVKERQGTPCFRRRANRCFFY